MAKNPGIEALLKLGAYKYRYADKLPFKEIDLKASEENPARLRRKIDDHVVTQYGCAMLDGAVFPPIVVFVRDQAKHLVGTGMHRIKASIEVKVDWFDAYLVTEPDQYRQDLLLRLLNGIEGVRDTKKEQLYHMIAMHEKYPAHSLAELAKQFHFSAQTAQNAWNEHQGIKRASRLGFDFEGKQPQSTIISLNQINSDLVYDKAAQLVHYFDVKARAVDDMVREIKTVKAKGQDAEMAVVKRYHDQAEDAARRAKSRIGKTSSTVGTKFIGRCRGLNRVAAKGVEHLHLSAMVDAQDSLDVILDTIDNLKKVEQELRRIIRLTGGGSRGGSGLAQAAAPPC